MKYDHYLVEISEPMSSNEFYSVRVMMGADSVWFRGDKAELVLDILHGKGLMMTDEQMLATLREKDEKIKVMQEQIEELTDVRDYLRKENKRLTGETTKFSDAISERNREIVNLDRENEKLRRQHSNQKQTIVEQREAIEALGKKNTELLTTISDKNAENCLLVGERDFWMSKIKAMEKTHEMGINAEWLRKELNKYGEENERLRKKNGDLADRNFDLAEELEKKEAEIKRLYEAGYGDKRVYDLMNELKKLEMKNKELEGMYNTQCEVVKEQQKQLKGSHEYMHKLEKRIDEQKTTIDILEKSYAEAMAEKDKKIRKLKESELAIDNLNLRTENKHLKGQVNRFKTACLKAGEEIKRLNEYFEMINPS